MKRRPKYRIYLARHSKKTRTVELGFDNRREAFDAARGLVNLGQVPTLVFCYHGGERRVWMIATPGGPPLPYDR